MDEAQIVADMIFPSSQDSTEVLQPGEQTFDAPTANVTAQHAPILGLGLGPVSAVWGDELDVASGELGVESVAVVGAIADQPGRLSSNVALGESILDKGDFMRASRRRVDGDWKTSAVCHRHELRALAPLGLAHSAAPFFAATKAASMKHSDKSSLPRLRRSSANASSTDRSTPVLHHSWKRRWQVWYGGKRSGRSRHGAPVRKIHSTPFITARVSVGGRPRPSSRSVSSGKSGPITAHCSSVSSSRRPISSLPGHVTHAKYRKVLPMYRLTKHYF
jgi:hypothetical protein